MRGLISLVDICIYMLNIRDTKALSYLGTNDFHAIQIWWLFIVFSLQKRSLNTKLHTCLQDVFRFQGVMMTSD